MLKKRTIRKGALVRCSKTKNVGVVVKVIGECNNPQALIVKVDGVMKKWTIREEEKKGFFKNIMSTIFNKSS